MEDPETMDSESENETEELQKSDDDEDVGEAEKVKRHLFKKKFFTKQPKNNCARSAFVANYQQ